jgi:hypothetical protein
MHIKSIWLAKPSTSGEGSTAMPPFVVASLILTHSVDIVLFSRIDAARPSKCYFMMARGFGFATKDCQKDSLKCASDEAGLTSGSSSEIAPNIGSSASKLHTDSSVPLSYTHSDGSNNDVDKTSPEAHSLNNGQATTPMW